jgi:hypothetical protein
MMEEVVVRFPNVEVRWGFLHEGIVEVFMEKFKFLIKPMVHGTRTKERGMCMLSDGVGI